MFQVWNEVVVYSIGEGRTEKPKDGHIGYIVQNEISIIKAVADSSKEKRSAERLKNN